MIRISKHATKRYRERIRPCTHRQARDDILSHSRVIDLAIAIGARIVRLGDGSRLCLDGSTVVTVLGKDMHASNWA